MWLNQTTRVTPLTLAFYCKKTTFKPLSVNSGKQIQNSGPPPSALSGKKSGARRWIICICFYTLDISGNRARWRLPKMAYIFFQRDNFPSHWHMPFELNIIRLPNWHSICTLIKFSVPTVTLVGLTYRFTLIKAESCSFFSKRSRNWDSLKNIE